jgi:hypothetical protein
VAAGKTVCRHRGQNVAGSTTGCRKVESGGCEGQNHRLQEFGQMKIPHIYVYVYVDVDVDVDVYIHIWPEGRGLPSSAPALLCSS